MSRREKRKAKLEPSNGRVSSRKKASKEPVVFLSSGSGSDEEEANEDLSLRILEDARTLQKAKAAEDGLVLNPSDDSAAAAAADSDSGGRIDLSSSSAPESELILNRAGAGDEKAGGVENDDKESGKKKTKKKQKKKKKKAASAGVADLPSSSIPEEATANVVEEDKRDEADGVVQLGTTENQDAVPAADSIVLRKLLRGPRYFDPPDSGWGSCFNCGEQGHLAANCMSAKRRKACFLCGSLEHNAKTCTEGKYCFICNKGGHRAKDCPDKYKRGSRSLKICLKCGDSGHDMFSCRNDYSSEDLKEIQCYICKDFGHLCCGKFVDIERRQVSCYQCGQLGHTGLTCTRSGGESSTAGVLSQCYKCGVEGHFARECPNEYKRASGDTPGAGSAAGACYKCGEDGHFARECMKEDARFAGDISGAGSVGACYKCGEEGHFARQCRKVTKRSRELSTPTRDSPRKDKYSTGSRSVPQDMGHGSKKKRMLYEEKNTPTSHRSKHRGGWLTEDPGDLHYGKAKVNSWRSPVTPYTTSRNNYFVNSLGGYSESYDYENSNRCRFETPTSQGLSTSGHRRFSARRFGNSGSSGRRNYDW